ncbi:Nuclear pore complex protein Nup107, partial [Exaiptasia diaphana]
GVKRSVSEAHHVIQRHVILNDIHGLLKVMNEWLQEEPTPTSHMLRFMAHFALFLRASGLETH